LLGYRFCNYIGIQLRLADFHDVDLHIHLGQLLELLADAVYFLASFTDNDTWSGSLNRDRHTLECALDDHVGYTTLFNPCLKVDPDFFILDYFVSIVVTSIPIRLPSADDA
jgi:hypothetical protein